MGSKVNISTYYAQKGISIHTEEIKVIGGRFYEKRLYVTSDGHPQVWFRASTFEEAAYSLALYRVKNAFEPREITRQTLREMPLYHCEHTNDGLEIY